MNLMEARKGNFCVEYNVVDDTEIGNRNFYSLLISSFKLISTINARLGRFVYELTNDDYVNGKLSFDVTTFTHFVKFIRFAN